jgi:hypothetical protein
MMAAPLSIASNIPQGVEVQLRRFYYDIAQIAYPAPIAAFAKVAEPSHILWGTDFPFRHGEEYVQRLPACGLSVSELRRIERENALPLFPRLRIDCRSPGLKRSTRSVQKIDMLYKGSVRQFNIVQRSHGRVFYSILRCT